MKEPIFKIKCLMNGNFGYISLNKHWKKLLKSPSKKHMCLISVTTMSWVGWFSAAGYMKVKRLRITEILRRIRTKSLVRKQQTQLIHTVSSQDFRSFSILSVFLSKNVQLNFFCEITTYTSRHLSFDQFFSIWSWLLILIPIFS